MSMSQSHCPVPGALQASSGTEARAVESRAGSSAHTASKPQRPGLAQRVEHRVLRGIAICVSPGPGALPRRVASWRGCACGIGLAWACARRRLYRLSRASEQPRTPTRPRRWRGRDVRTSEVTRVDVDRGRVAEWSIY